MGDWGSGQTAEYGLKAWNSASTPVSWTCYGDRYQYDDVGQDNVAHVSTAVTLSES